MTMTDNERFEWLCEVLLATQKRLNEFEVENNELQRIAERCKAESDIAKRGSVKTYKENLKNRIEEAKEIYASIGATDKIATLEAVEFLIDEVRSM